MPVRASNNPSPTLARTAFGSVVRRPGQGSECRWSVGWPIHGLREQQWLHRLVERRFRDCYGCTRRRSAAERAGGTAAERPLASVNLYFGGTGLSPGPIGESVMESEANDMLYVQANHTKGVIGQRPERIETCRCKEGKTCAARGTGANWTAWASVSEYNEYFNVSPAIRCDTDKVCIAAVDHSCNRWQPVGSGGAVNRLLVMLYSVDDNKVGLAKTKWELRVPLRIQTVAACNIGDDDKLQFGLKRRDYNDNGRGWIEVSGLEGTLPTTAMV